MAVVMMDAGRTVWGAAGAAPVEAAALRQPTNAISRRHSLGAVATITALRVQQTIVDSVIGPVSGVLSEDE